jgi:cation diffusion facilitator family transporter
LQKTKLRAARLSIFAGSFLTIGKLVVGLSMNSISVVSEALHSGLDLIAALIAYIAIRISGQPADDSHQYGHGKFENIAAIFEALLIVIAGALIISQAIPRLKGGSVIHALDLGAAVMGASVVINYGVSIILIRTAKKTDSPALAADGWHLRTDAYTSLGVLAGIIAIRLTGLVILDPLIALGVTLLIFKAAFDLLRESVGSILDTRLPEADEKIILGVLKDYDTEFVEFHKLRTRKAGAEKHMDLHLVVRCRQPIDHVHNLCERIEKTLREKIKDMHILIHPEPCRPEDNNCVTCSMSEKNLKK